MKRIVSLLLIGMLLFVMTAPAYADGESKLKSGVKQIFTSPKIAYETIVEEKDASEFKPFGILGGICKGTFYMLKDAGQGLINVLTFFTDNK